MADVLGIFRRLLITFTSRCHLGVPEGDAPLLVRLFDEVGGSFCCIIIFSRGGAPLPKTGTGANSSYVNALPLLSVGTGWFFLVSEHE